ncbi:hypothetical protein C9J48_08290 [Photobacterium profundum]|uniref:Uncharacterized protein n=1 Tax=Photobacterium profundum 3TCK TaxID=314280 RepID=Q1ZAX2_9GAMM|nr:hypothetical protein [Photobacterium profundum]EAS45370.1 hypothetical protein P3TCK_03316 [Photobacterium profundum 3TCK]PSV63440.1 hypothetical protein C9J48_08290 [Photobacterium profundum]
MSLVKIQSKVLKQLSDPIHSITRANVSYTLSNGGVAARLYKHVMFTNSHAYDVGLRVSIVRLYRNSMIIITDRELDVLGSYELSLQGIHQMNGYITMQEMASDSAESYTYEFHQNDRLTDQELSLLIADLL